jgi:hypothetical protein
VRRSLLAAVLFAALVALPGCGGDSRSSAERPPAKPGTLQAIWDRPGPNVTIVPGTDDYAAGDVRVSFLVVRKDGRQIVTPRARLWVAASLHDRPFANGSARLELVRPPGSGDPLDVKYLYVSHLRLTKPGTYWFVAEPVGGSPIQAAGTLVVKPHSATPAIGERPPASRTPTLGTAPVRLLTTRTPPDRSLLRYSVAESLAAHVPFVVVFATPKFCTSRTCGPVVDVVERVARGFPSVRFIHVEIYRDNDPQKGYNRWVREWRLPSEPWTFVVGSNGRIASKFEGSVSERELRAAVRGVA